VRVLLFFIIYYFQYVLLSFSEFPDPGDARKHLLPVLIDEEQIASELAAKKEQENQQIVPQNKFWMPDRYCKVCYGCEEPFTMYRRRHHCRMCGQIFCNSCSSFYIDGKMFNSLGVVRACKICFEQQEKGDGEYKLPKPHRMLMNQELMTAAPPQEIEQQYLNARATASVPSPASWIAGGHVKIEEGRNNALSRSSNLQARSVGICVYLYFAIFII
jgi:1-phosphatidylinositol-3-phosphate 5-kinase